MELKAYAPGIYPRSEALVQATRDLERGRTTQEAVDGQRERDAASSSGCRSRRGSPSSPTGCSTGRTSSARSPSARRASTRGRSRAFSTRTPSTGRCSSTATPKLRDPIPAPDLPDRPLACHAPIAGRLLACLGRRGVRAGARGERARAPDRGVQRSGLRAGRARRPVRRRASARSAGADLARGRATAGRAVRPPASVRRRGLRPHRARGAPVAAVGIDFYSTSIDAVPEASRRTSWPA